MFIAALFAIVKTWKQPKCPLTDKWIKKLWYILYNGMLLLLLSHFSRVQLCVTPWTAAYQAPPSRVFPRREYWSGVPLPSPKWNVIQPY